MPGNFGNFSLTQLFLAATIALSLVLSAWQAMQLTRGSIRSSVFIRAIAFASALVTLSVLTIDALQAGNAAENALAPLPAMGLLLMGSLLVCIHLRAANLRLSADRMRREPAAWVALLASLATGAWTLNRFLVELAPAASQAVVQAARPLNMEREAKVVGISDRGREIALFRSSTVSLPAGSAYHIENGVGAEKLAPMSVIARGAPDASANCHGWVFAGGEYLLDIDGVRTILADNGYVPTPSPQPGNVIVYFNADKVPVHSGVVSGLLPDGTVVVESKWGIDGRYLHRPEDQPYAEQFTYFRSPRGGNAIAIRASNTAIVKHRLPVKRRIRKA